MTVELVPELLAIDGDFFQRVLDCETIGGLTCVFSSELTEAHFNRILTLQGDEKLSGKTLREVIERFQTRQRVPCLYLNLSGVDPHIIDTLLDFGFRRHDETLSIMYAEEWNAAPRPPGERIMVSRAGKREKKAWASVLAEANGIADTSMPAIERFFDKTVDAGGEMYLARESGRPIGTGTLVLGEGIAGIYNVSTAENGRHRGVATALVESMVRRARVTGLPVTLQAVTGSTAERLYKRFGFRTVSYTGIFTRQI